MYGGWVDTEGGYTCLCHRGFRASVDQTLCMGESPLLPLFADQEAKGWGGTDLHFWDGDSASIHPVT